jgi:hypothetical protein
MAIPIWGAPGPSLLGTGEDGSTDSRYTYLEIALAPQLGSRIQCGLPGKTKCSSHRGS